MNDTEILEEVARITKAENPCNIRREGRKVVCNGYEGKPCCTGCTHLSKNGCTVAAPACRFWFCSVAYSNLSQLSKQRLAVLLFEYEGELRWRHSQYKVGKTHGQLFLLLNNHPKLAFTYDTTTKG